MKTTITMAIITAFLFLLVPTEQAYSQLTCTNGGASCTADAECAFCEHPEAAATVGAACATAADCNPASVGFCLGGNTPGAACDADNDCTPNGGANAGTCVAATCTDLGSCLPVELTFFTAKVNHEGSIALTWQTATELNNSGFEIELSLDNQIFVPVAFVEGFGTTEISRDYSFEMSPETHGTHFIRLKQIDFDGRFEMSDIVEVTTGIPGDFKMQANYPNPFNPTTKIQFVVSENLQTAIKVFDSLGQEIATLFNGEAPAGINQLVEFDAENYPSGTYYVKMITPIGSEIRAMTLSR